MNQIKLQELISDRHIVIPMYILKMYRDWHLNIDEFSLLLYLFDKDKMVFDPVKISNDLNSEITSVMQNISNLSDKGLIKVNAIKNENNVTEEVIDLSCFYEMVTIKLMEELNKKEENDLDIHKLIEDEFGRGLSPLEHELIDEWENNNYDKNIIKEAVKEASINGVTTLRYIDKILFDWNEKGIKNIDDLKNKKETKEEEIIEVYNCDWLNDEEEI